MAKLNQNTTPPGEGPDPQGAAPSSTEVPRWVLHPILIGMYLPISLYSANFDSLPFSALIRPLELSILAACLLYAGCWLLLRNKAEGAIVASFLLATFWGWSFFESLVNDEEGHFDEFDKQLDNIKRFGPSYLALQSFGTAPPETGGGE